MAEYLRFFKKEFIIIFHNRYSPLGELGVTSFKALSRYLGSFALPINFDKVILVERRFSTFIFGYSPKMPVLRSSYVGTYAAYARANNIQDYRILDCAGKRKLLRNQRFLPYMEEVKVEEIVEEGSASKIPKL
jgi:hypothetical protein